MAQDKNNRAPVIGAVAIHEFRQPIQSAYAWIDICKVYIAEGEDQKALDALTRVGKLLEEVDDHALDLVKILSSETERC